MKIQHLSIAQELVAKRSQLQLNHRQLYDSRDVPVMVGQWVAPSQVGDKCRQLLLDRWIVEIEDLTRQLRSMGIVE